MEDFNPSLEHRIVRFLQRPDYVPLKKHELMAALETHEADRATFRHILHELEAKGKIIRLRKNRWAAPEVNRQTTGRLSAHPQGFGFVVSEDPSMEDIFIPEKAMGTALDGDRVLVRYGPSRPPKSAGKQRKSPLFERLEGVITRIVERGYESIVGLLKKNPYYWYVIPDNPRLLHSIRIRQSPFPCVEDHKVVIRLDAWERADQPLTGELIEDLGAADERGVDVVSVMRQYGLQEEFPSDAEQEARRTRVEPSALDFEGRRDLREQVTFTIDPEDAKDYDDAVSLMVTPEGHYRLGVHIADVAHYVRRGSAVDKEAFLRGNSVYMVDRTVTMLPPHLTTEICSLYPHVDRLTHTAEILLDADGNILSSETFPSVIHSTARLHYDQVQAFFDHAAIDGIPEPVLAMLTVMRKLARTLRKTRMREQSLDVSLPEIKCLLDAQGRPVSFRRRGASEAYHLIEEFMLLANQVVAQRLADGDRPAMFRIHAPPDNEQWERMSIELAALNVPSTPHSTREINELFAAYRNTPLEYSVSLALLRNQKRARYAASRSDHFGLGFTHYTHFTSPIRRYADLIIHRLLGALEETRPSPYSSDELETIASHCSRTEEEADKAEEQSVEVKRLAYYDGKWRAGEAGPLNGHVVSIAPKGLIVELDESLQRGLLPFSALTDDFYEANTDRSMATGKRKRGQWNLGQPVAVYLAKVDKARGRVDFYIRDRDIPRATKSGRGKKRRKGRKRGS